MRSSPRGRRRVVALTMATKTQCVKPAPQQDGEKDPLRGDRTAAKPRGGPGRRSVGSGARHGVLLRPLRHGLHGRLSLGVRAARRPSMVSLGARGSLALRPCGPGSWASAGTSGGGSRRRGVAVASATSHATRAISWSRVEAAPRAPRLSRSELHSLVLVSGRGSEVSAGIFSQARVPVRPRVQAWRTGLSRGAGPRTSG